MSETMERTQRQARPSSPEEKLLSGVLAQAVVDLSSPHLSIREGAIGWFLGAPPNPMLVWLCECLGYDVGNVRATVRVMASMPRLELAELVRGLVGDVVAGRPALGLLALRGRAA